jgi:hypothetical protein
MRHPAIRTDRVAVRLFEPAMTVVSVVGVTDRSNTWAGVVRGTA